MARTTSGGPLRLLFVLAALCNHLAAADSVLTASSNKNIAFAGNRKLLQGSGSSGSTVFGDPPAGTLVVTWNPIPAKHSDNPDYGEITAAPYQYDWFNIYPISSNCANCSTLYFYPAAAYVAGPGGQKTQLIVSSGGCDLTTREYADLGQLTNSCQGSFAVPDNKTVAVSQVWDLLQAPDNLEFQVPTPLASLDCIAFFFGPSGPSMSGEALTNFQATFDTGPIPIKPAGTDNTLPTGIFSNIGFESLPISGPGTLTFKSINMRLTYDPPVPIKGFDWSFLYAHCAFSSDQLTVRSVVPPPVGQPVGGTCDPRSSTPNQCFNAAGNYYVCCTTHCPANPGPTPTCSVLDPVPEAHPVGGTCDPKSNEPNQCFNSDGSYYVCCPGQCGGNPSLRPACA